MEVWRDDWGDTPNSHFSSRVASDACKAGAHGRVVTVDIAAAKAVAIARAVEGTERVALLEATGRVVARDLLAPIDLAPFDNSAMDGYAVRRADLRGRRTVAASPCRHGSPQATRLRLSTRRRRSHFASSPGRLFLRASTRWSCRSVANAQGDQIVFSKRPRAGENIRHAGEDVRAGTRILRPAIS